LDEVSEIEGPALEGLVAQHLRAWCDYSNGGHALYYWQTRSQVEVDFVIFGEDYPESQRFLLYRGSEKLARDGIQCIPCEIFLRALKPGLIPLNKNCGD
jgi:predicted AAA+ superfamily ATPase